MVESVQSSAEIILDSVEKVKLRVLHVDDEPSLLKIAKQCLEAQGPIQVDTAGSVQEAMEKMQTTAYDVIVSDYQMPAKDGLEFLKELREKGNRIPFIIFTGKGREEVAIKALNLGANQYLNKMGETETVYTELAHSIKQMAKTGKAEEELRKSEEKFRNLFEKANDGLVFADLSGRIVDINHKAAEIAGIKKENIIGKSVFELGIVSSKDLPALAERLRQNAMGQPTQSMELEIEKENGEKKILEIHSTLFQKENASAGFLAIVRDITERKKMETDLFDNHSKLQNIFAASPDAIVVTDLYANITDCNQAALNLYGCSSKDRLARKSALDLIPKEDKPRAIEQMKEAAEHGPIKDAQYALAAKDGHKYPAEISASVVKNSSGKPEGFVAIIRDITRRKETETALKESEERYHSLFEQSPIGIGLATHDGIVIDANKTVQALLGYSKEELKQINLVDLYEKPEQRKELLEAVKQRGAVADFQARWKRKDGTSIGVLMNVSLVHVGGKSLLQTTVQDVTKCKKDAEDSKMMNEKLRVVGALTRHDARNKLAIVTGNAYLARKKLAGDNEAQGYLSEIESAVSQVVHIFDFASAYEKIGVEKPVYVDVEKTVEEAVMLFSDLHGVKVANECHGLTVLADSLLRQFFYNLIDNSLKHGARTSQIRVHYEKAEGEQLRLVYEDNGVGISPDAKTKLFNEGFASSQGPAYGLFLIKKIAEAYRWNLQETGTLSKGARFTATIPKTNQNGEESYQLH